MVSSPIKIVDCLDDQSENTQIYEKIIKSNVHVTKPKSYLRNLLKVKSNLPKITTHNQLPDIAIPNSKTKIHISQETQTTKQNNKSLNQLSSSLLQGTEEESKEAAATLIPIRKSIQPLTMERGLRKHGSTHDLRRSRLKPVQLDLNHANSKSLVQEPSDAEKPNQESIDNPRALGTHSRSRSKLPELKISSRHDQPSPARSFKDKLYYDARALSVPRSSIKNTIIEDLLRNEETITKDSSLIASLLKLRDMKLLRSHRPNLVKHKGVGKIDFVYNESHSIFTNPAYSRNSLGTFFTR